MPTKPISRPIIIDECKIPEGARAVLRDVMVMSGVSTCKVTNSTRTPAKQASVMYDNCIGTGPNQGVAAQYQLYKASGDSIIDVFVKNSTKPRGEVVKLMEAEIVRVGPTKVSHHCLPADADRWVFDVGPASIEEQLHVAFMDAAKKHPRVIVFLGPGQADPAFHFEVKKS